MDNVWFSETVHAAFGFLVFEQGFSMPRVTSAAGTLELLPPKPNPSFQYASVIYQKGDTYVEAAHGTHGVEFELILGFGRYSLPGRNRGLWAYLEDLLEIVAPEFQYPPRGVITSLEQKFAFFIRENANALRLHGKRFFENDRRLESEIENLKHKRMEEQKNDEINRRNKWHRESAKAAFANSNWALTVSHYRAVTDHLSAAEAKRFSIAKKRLAEGW